MLIAMLEDAVIRAVEAEVKAVSLRHGFKVLSSEDFARIYSRYLLTVHAEYRAVTRKKLVDPVIIVKIGERNAASGFKEPPQAVGVSLEEACTKYDMVKPGWGAQVLSRPLSPGMFRVIVLLQFATKFYSLQIPLPPQLPPKPKRIRPAKP